MKSPHVENLQVQTAGSDDLEAILSLLRMQYAEHAIVVSPALLAEAARGVLGHPGRGAILLARGPEVLGMAALAYLWSLEHGGRVAWLDEMFVLPAHRGRGIGRLLLRVALVVAQKAGCRVAQLEVVQGHERAEHLYRREGFASVARRRWNCSLAAALEGPHGE